MKKLLFVFGTRPEFIKLAPVVKAAEAAGNFVVITCALLQHQRMLGEQFRTFDIKPSYVFPLPFGDRGLMSRNPLRRLWSVAPVGWGFLSYVRMLRRERPDLLIVQGDTSTAFIAALIAFHLKIKIAHVEAGLRSGDKYAPFPEEMNRRLVTPLADLHFAPTPRARDNLLREGVPASAITVTGNTELDALRMVLERQGGGDAGQGAGEKLILVTAHRRESFGEGMERIADALLRIAREHPEASIVYPVHLNPNVRGVMERRLRGVPNIALTDPLEYEPFVSLMRRAYIILTDSGGVQEAVSLLGKPALVLREVTERPEGVEAGNAMVVGTDTEKIVRETARLLTDAKHYAAMAKTHTAYGDGHAARRIVEEIGIYLNQ